MRSFSLLLATLLLSCSAVLSDTCNKPLLCPTNPSPVPLPFYSLTFDTPSATAVTYGYNATDNDGCGHTGLAVTGINGGGSAGVATGYVDLVNTTSAQYAGSQLPTIGSSTVGGNLFNGTRGWTFETTFKPLAQTTYAKVWIMGNGAGPANVILGYNNNNLELDFTVYTASGNNYARTNTNNGNAVLTTAVVLNTWYHISIVVQQVDNAGVFANWFMYINGVLVNNTGTTQFNIPDSVRPYAYLGRSTYSGDQLFKQEVDTFRIYNMAINQDQAASLYAQQMGGCNITMVANPPTYPSFPTALQYNQTSTPNALWGLGFVADPRVAVGTGVVPAYNWELYDYGDAACGLNNTHYGLLVLAGGPDPSEVFSDPSFVNLTATSGPNAITGPNAVGYPALPQLGGGSFTTGSVANGTAGISFELTFKPALQETWAKIFDIGSFRSNPNNCANDIVFGWVGSSLQYMNFEICDPNGNGVSMGQFGPFLAGYWYHVVISVQLLSNGNANWFAYQNGVLVGVQSNSQFPQAANRPLANLGKSNWNDETWSGWVDSFNIYSYAMTPNQVYNLTTVALGPSLASACAFTQSTQSAVRPSDVYYDLSFTTNPSVTNQAYGWLPYDTTDSAAMQTVHRGLVNISGCVSGGCAGTYINMSAPTGANSVGKVLNDVGGIGTGSISDNTVGWSFELTFKSFGPQTWAKVMDLGDGVGGGNGVWEIFFGWHSSDPFYNMGVIFSTNQDYNSNSNNIPAAPLDDLTPATPNLNNSAWQHVVIIMKYDYLSSETNSGTTTYDGGMDFASFSVYTNGVLTANSTNNLFPAKASRINSLLGKSNYGDSFWQGLIDTFRVYSIALTPQQVNTLYVASSQPITTGSSSTGGVTVVSSSSGSSSGGSVVPTGNTTSSTGTIALSSVPLVSAPTAVTPPVTNSTSGMSSSTTVSSTAAGTRSSSSSSSSVLVPVVVSTTSSMSSSSSSSTGAAIIIVVPSSTASNYVTPAYITSVASATSTYFPPTVVNGAAQSASAVFTIAAAVMALLALML